MDSFVVDEKNVDSLLMNAPIEVDGKIIDMPFEIETEVPSLDWSPYIPFADNVKLKKFFFFGSVKAYHF